MDFFVLPILGLEVGIFCAGCEAGAVLGYVGKLAMADDAGLRVVAMQLLQELVEGCLLLRSTSIGIFAFDIDAALVTDAE